MRTIKGSIVSVLCLLFLAVLAQQAGAASRPTSQRNERSWVINLEFKIKLHLPLPFFKRKAVETAVAILRNSPPRKAMPREVDRTIHPVVNAIKPIPVMPRAEDCKLNIVPVVAPVIMPRATDPLLRQVQDDAMHGLPSVASFAASLEKRVTTRCANLMPRAESPVPVNKSEKVTHGMPVAADFAAKLEEYTRLMPRAESPSLANESKTQQNTINSPMPKAADTVRCNSCTDQLSEPLILNRQSLNSDEPICWMMCH